MECVCPETDRQPVHGVPWISGRKWVDRFNTVLETARLSDKWRGVLVPIFKKMADVQSCGNYREIKLISHTTEMQARVSKARSGKEEQ